MDLEISNLIIGYRRDGSPIFNIIGFEDEDEIEDDDAGVDDENEDAEDESGEDENSEEDEKKTPAKKAPAKKAPAKSAAGTAYERALARERDARKSAERQLRELRKKNETDGERIAREADEYAAARYKPGAVRAAARAALTEAKIKGDVTRAVRLLDLEGVDIDEDGEVVGLDEQVATLKSDYPELFEEQRRSRPKPPRIDAAGRKAPKGEAKTSAEKIAAQFGLT